MKMQPYTNIDEYIANFPQETQKILQKIRKLINEMVPKGEETISYGIPTIKSDGKYVVYFAGYAHHVSVYPIPPGPEAFKKEITPYIKGKGTLQFPLDKPIPYDLIQKVVQYHLERHKNL